MTEQDVINIKYQNALDQAAPHAIMRPSISLDGNLWCALYGKNLQDGVAGFGETPELAMRDFDRNWTSNLAAKTQRRQGGE
jgi:hypothetical protein